MPEPQLKGSAYLSTLAFIETHFGAAAKERVLARLTPEDRAVLGHMVLPIQWYPLEPFPRLLRAMDAEVGRGDLSLVTDRGIWAAVQDMRTVHRVLLKLVTAQWVVEKGMKLWPNFHTSGRWESKRDGDKGARATLHDLGVVDEAMCATLKGWIIGLLQLAGKRATVDHDQCRARGAATCAYHVYWK
ncbi:MAG TPA: 4-vinyl reductase [Polyangia bacterium]